MSLFNLSFLAPLAFLGLISLAIPLYLHMRHKPRAEIFPFPAIDFLLKAQRKRKRRFRVEQWILMAFRMLVILLLAVLFAKPFIDSQNMENSHLGAQPLIIILDDSASMLAGSRASERFFERARRDIEDLLNSRASGAKTRLLPASQPDALAGFESAAQIGGELNKLKPTTYGVTLDAAWQAALELVERENWPQTTIRIFTDGSATAWTEIPTQKPDKVDVIYTNLRDDDFRNLAITNVDQAPGDTNSVEISLYNSDEVDREINLAIQGPGMSPLRHQMRVNAGSPGAHRFGLSDPLPATLTVSLPEDDFDLDNQVLMAPQPNKAIYVLLVDGDTHPEAVRNESFFFRNALGGDESEKYGYEVHLVTPTGLNASMAEQADVICLLNVDAPPTDLLEAALRAGKGVFISMGDRMVFERWNLFLKDQNLEMWESQEQLQPMAIEIKEFDHALFPPITELEWQGYLSGAVIQNLRLVSLGRSNFRVPLALTNGFPLLLTRETQPGRIMIWTSSVDLDWNNFPLEFGFVPFVRQLTSWLAGRDGTAAHRSFTTSQLRDATVADTLNLKYPSPGFEDLDVAGIKPGIYTSGNENRTEFVQVLLDPAELDFRSVMGEKSETSQSKALEELGFRSYLRSDLAPSIQWLLFLLILLETLVAARITLNWGAR